MQEYKITKKDILYRRIPLKPYYWKVVNGKSVPSSFAFKTKPDEDGLSVNIAALTTVNDTIIDVDMFGVAEFLAKVPLELGYECLYDPQPENKAHALIEGNTNKIAKKLSLSAKQVFPEKPFEL